MRAYVRWVGITRVKPRPMTADYYLAFLTNRLDGLFERDRLVGLIETAQQDEDLLIVNVAVYPDCQGQGFGMRMMKHAERLACGPVVRATRPYASKLMTDNISLYERLGYRFEKQTRHDLGTVAVRMLRPLS